MLNDGFIGTFIKYGIQMNIHFLTEWKLGNFKLRVNFITQIRYLPGNKNTTAETYSIIFYIFKATHASHELWLEAKWLYCKCSKKGFFAHVVVLQDQSTQRTVPFLSELREVGHRNRTETERLDPVTLLQTSGQGNTKMSCCSCN